MSLADRVRTLRDVSRIVREPIRLGVRQTRGANAVSRYTLRGSGISIHLRDDVTEDVATLVQTFSQRHYMPPPAIRARLAELGRPPRAMDLGANIGMFGAWFLSQYPGAKVTAYEADPDNARVHGLTVEANRGTHRWQLYAAAAASEDGEVAFVGGRATNSRLAEPGEDSTTVPAHDVLGRAADVDLFKVDIEGGEWALLSDERFITLPACVVALEFHAYRCPSSNPHRAARELLSAAGYHVLEHDLAAPPGHGMVWGWRTA